MLNKIICGDVIRVLADIPAESVDLVVTSPPYNLGIEYDGFEDKISWPDYFNWCREWLSGLYRVLKSDGRICINHYMSFGTSIERLMPLSKLNQIIEGIGYKHHAQIVWEDRTVAKRTAWGSWLSASAPYCNSPYEGILINYKESWKKLTKGESTMTKEEFMELTSGVWKLGTSRSKHHPAVFPITFPEKCIKLLTYKDDAVLDPFCGIGTTCVAARNLGRRYIGIDQSRKYCDVAEEKLA